MDYKKELATLLGLGDIDIESMIVATQETANGDYSLPCFKLAKAYHKSPMVIADELRAKISSLPAWLSKVESASGYLNFFLSKESFVNDTVESLLIGTNHPKNNKTICIDYSSINIAKPFHIGHLLTTAIGGSLYRIYKYLGYNVVGINHLGDWGTQFGKLITAYLKWGSEEDLVKRGINCLLELYVKFHVEAEKDKSLEDEGRLWFKKIEDNDEQAVSIFQRFKAITLEEVQKTYVRLGIEFDSYNGESFYNDKLSAVVDELQTKGLLSDSLGAKVVNLDEYNMPPCLILKSDGASLYATRDLAAAKYRKETYDFYKCLYVVAYQQNLHFKQVFTTIKLMGYDWYKDLVHVPFGMVSLENGTLSTRKGNVVFLSDVLDNAVKKTAEIIENKNPNLENKALVAEQVGVGAVIFGALSNDKIKDMVFSYDKVLSFEGETGPYVQYTHARCCSVISKVVENNGKFNASLICDDDSVDLVKLLAKFEDTIIQASEKYEPSILTRLLVDIAQAFNKFYFSNRILCEDSDTTYSRLVLVKLVKDTLKKGLELVLISAPEQM